VDSYDALLVAWGIAWMLGGFVLVYLVHWVARAEEEMQAGLHGKADLPESGATSTPGARAA